MLGRKTITAPTPPMTPSTSRSRSGPAGSSADPSHQRVDPLLRIGSEAERAPEHEPHQREEDRESPQLVRHEGVDHGRRRHLLAPSGGEGLLQRTLDESVFLVGEGRFDILAQLPGDAPGLAVADFGPHPVTLAAAEALFGLPRSSEAGSFSGVRRGRRSCRR